MIIRVICILLVTITVILSSSCALRVQENDEYYGGESMNAQILSDIAESIFAEDYESESGYEDETISDKSEHDGVYYWTDSGSVYHKWKNCGHIKNSKDLKSGTLDEAILSGKEKLCSSCDKKD